MRLIDADELIANLIDWRLCELPEPNVNYISGRMVTDHERQYEITLLLEDVAKEVAEQKEIDAIPVEWIRQWYKSREYLTEGKTAICRMIWDWEKENV